jgi:3-phenylpropionate/trans-cinnamate dioxygenase ferredoxin component
MASKTENWVAICSSNRLARQTIVCAGAGGCGSFAIRDGNQIFACERARPREQPGLSSDRVAGLRLFCPRHLASFVRHDANISAGWPSRPPRVYPARVKDETFAFGAQEDLPTATGNYGPAAASNSNLRWLLVPATASLSCRRVQHISNTGPLTH